MKTTILSNWQNWLKQNVHVRGKSSMTLSMKKQIPETNVKVGEIK
jgi:hypothetical protein